jgi:hypothetical protein
MNVVEALIEAVDSRNYHETVFYVDKLNTEVLGYQKIAECSAEERMGPKMDLIENAMKSLEDTDTKTTSPLVLPVSIAVHQTLPGVTGVTITTAQIMSKAELGKKTSGIATDRCWNYGNFSKEDPEGVVTKIFFQRVNDVYRLGIEGFEKVDPLVSAHDYPPIVMFGYGKRWAGKGELMPALSCYTENLKIPNFIKLFDEIPFEKFIGLIKK